MLLLLQFSRSDSRLKEQKGEERRMRRRGGRRGEKRGGRRKEKMRIAGEKLSVVDIFHIRARYKSFGNFNISYVDTMSTNSIKNTHIIPALISFF